MDSSLAGGLKNLFRRIIFSIHGHVKWFLKIVFLCSEEIIVIGYNLVSFLHNFMENISFLTKCNVLFNNENLILIWFFLFIDNEFDLKITLRILNQKIIKYINENPQNVVIFKIVFSIMVAELYWQAFKGRQGNGPTLIWPTLQPTDIPTESDRKIPRHPIEKLCKGPIRFLASVKSFQWCHRTESKIRLDDTI